MSRLEDELRNALRRQEPPPGFAGRVLARAESETAPGRWFRLPLMRWAAAAALAGLVVAGVGFERARRERVQGEQAKEQVLLALRITGSKLRIAKERIYETNQH